MNENSPTVLVLLKETHSGRDCQVSREATEPHAVDCVRVCLDAWGLSEVLFKGTSESAAQALVDEMEVERSEKAVVEESPKCLYQSGIEVEDTVQRIESPTRTRTRVLREKLGRKVDSKSIASSRPDRQEVLSQTEKRDDGHSTRSRVKGKECDGGPLAQVGETMGFKVACCEMAELLTIPFPIVLDLVPIAQDRCDFCRCAKWRLTTASSLLVTSPSGFFSQRGKGERTNAPSCLALHFSCVACDFAKSVVMR